MKEIILSIVFGMLPESLFFTIFLVLAKGIKERKKELFGLIIINYLLTGILVFYSIYSYFLFIIFQYIIIKILYKEKVECIDIFLIIISHIYLFLISILCYKVVNNYYIAFIINRVLLFVPFIFRKHFNELYNKYRRLWNRNDNNKIKSISLRNISLISLNIFIILSDIVCVYISKI